MMEEKKQVPQIRFKGYVDAWEQRKLGEVVDVYDGVHQTPDYTDKGIMFLSVENISTLKSEKYISEEAFNRDYKVYPEKGDILMTRIGDVGTPNVVETTEKVAFYVSLALLKPINVDSYFLCNSILSPFFHNGLKERTLVTAIPQKINKDEIGKVSLYLPNLIDEQKEIGAFFRHLNTLITLHQRKHDKLVNIKKSMLEKMFPKNGRDVPEIRFKGFTDAWEQRKTKDLCSISTGKSNTQDRVDDGIYPFYVRSPIVERSNRYLFDEEAVLTVGDGVGTGKVFHYVNGKYDLHQRVYRMFDFSEEITAKYFYYYFSNHFYDRVMAMTAKTSVDSVRYEMIADMDISLPKIQEQSAISDYFNNLDNLITLHQRKLEKLKNTKKSMLDKMFV